MRAPAAFCKLTAAFCKLTAAFYKLTAAVLTAVLIGAGGCQSAAFTTPVPALLNNTSTTTTAQLNAAASELLAGKPVTLGSSAFTKNNSLTLETAMRNTPLGRLGSGRIIEEPDALRLLRAGRNCLLEHINSGRKITLKLRNCSADPTATTD